MIFKEIKNDISILYYL